MIDRMGYGHLLELSPQPRVSSDEPMNLDLSTPESSRNERGVWSSPSGSQSKCGM
jgi:hypothetical protein